MQDREPLENAYDDVPGSRPRPREPSGARWVWALLGALVGLLLVWVVH